MDEFKEVYYHLAAKWYWGNGYFSNLEQIKDFIKDEWASMTEEDRQYLYNNDKRNFMNSVHITKIEETEIDIAKKLKELSSEVGTEENVVLTKTNTFPTIFCNI